MSASASGPAAKVFRLKGDYSAINRHYQGQGWTDGLPIVPPTDDDVREFLRFTDREPREVVAVLPPRQGEATVERIAINAVMAGCRPEYLPVILTAVEALTDPAFNLDSIQATTHPVTPLIIVNGPIAREIGINARLQRLRPGLPRQPHHRARAPPPADERGGWAPGNRRPRDPGHPGQDRLLRGRERGGESLGAPARRARLPAGDQRGHRDRVRGAAQHPGPLQLHRPGHPQGGRGRDGPGGQQQHPGRRPSPALVSGPSTRPPSRATATPSGR